MIEYRDRLEAAARRIYSAPILFEGTECACGAAWNERTRLHEHYGGHCPARKMAKTDPEIRAKLDAEIAANRERQRQDREAAALRHLDAPVWESEENPYWSEGQE